MHITVVSCSLEELSVKFVYFMPFTLFLLLIPPRRPLVVRTAVQLEIFRVSHMFKLRAVLRHLLGKTYTSVVQEAHSVDSCDCADNSLPLTF